MQVFMFIQEMIILYTIGLIGFIAKRKAILNKHADYVITQLILYITLPAIILYSIDFEFTLTMMTDFIILILLSIYILVVACGIALWMSKKAKLTKTREGVYQSLIIFGNQGFIGYAITYILYDKQGILYTAIFNLFFLVLIWTYGIYLIAKAQMKVNIKQIFLNPGIIATLIGIVFLILPAEWPSSVGKLLETVGMPTVPLSMILLGSFIANLNCNEIFLLLKNRHIWLAVTTKLLVLPLLLIPFTYFSIPLSLLMIAVLITAMPSAPTTPLFAYKYGADVSFATFGVFLSTLLSILTLPFMYILLQLLS